MESIYFSITWACHRKCVHCYEDRFRPYVRAELAEVVAQARRTVPQVIANLPGDMTYLDLDTPLAEGGFQRRTGRIILSGGEVLVDAIREPVLYPALEQLGAKYAGRCKIIVQTTGDLLTERIIGELLARGVWMIQVAGMDDFHVGLEGTKRDPLKERLIGWFEAAGMAASGLASTTRKWHDEIGPVYTFFGATPDAWIGKLWPRGRAWSNGLSTATIADNFCNRWSGGLNFLNHRYSGSEVAIDADGHVYPCCMKTKVPLGSVAEEPLLDILDSLTGQPAFEAINAGRPERMGLTMGWDVETFLAASETRAPGGAPYRNLCIGCDAFHEQMLRPVIDAARAERQRRRATAKPVEREGRVAARAV